ncbi:hypothetical protein MT418_006118 [Batrachochytrium dendrobatidis]
MESFIESKVCQPCNMLTFKDEYYQQNIPLELQLLLQDHGHIVVIVSNISPLPHFKPIHQSLIRLAQYSPATCIPFLQRLVHRIHVYSVCCFDCDLHQPRIMEFTISFVESVHNVCFNVVF